MDRARVWLEQNRRIAVPVLAVVIAVLVFYVISRILGSGTVAEEPAPAPAPGPAAPAPAPAAPPVVQPPAPAAPPAPGGTVVLAGRSDPFAPLVSERPPAPPPPPSAGGGPTPLPPPPLPLPPLPPAPGTPGTPGTPGAPGGPSAQPAPAPSPSAGITVLGIISDAKSLVIVSINGKTEILFEGESAGDLKVIKIDPVRGVVTFERAGKRFDLTIGG